MLSKRDLIWRREIKMHNDRCEKSTSPICNCSCYGIYHGIKNDLKNGKYLSFNLGGRLEFYLKSWYNRKTVCKFCNTTFKIKKFVGIPSETGIKDRFDKGWDVYTICSDCKKLIKLN